MTVKLYEVGGAVRDRFIGRINKDIDYAVEASSYEEMKEHILATGGVIFLESPQYVTIRAKWSHLSLGKQTPCDFTLCRKESGYSDGRHPDHIEPGTILEDLARRDFTMNAIAINVESLSIIDPYGGIDDIDKKIIRTVGETKDRFKEDSLRMLRALRFSITLGFDITESIKKYISSFGDEIENVSSDRIREELYKMFSHDTIKSIDLIYKIGLDRYLFSNETGIWLKPTSESK